MKVGNKIYDKDLGMCIIISNTHKGILIARIIGSTYNKVLQKEELILGTVYQY